MLVTTSNMTEEICKFRRRLGSCGLALESYIMLPVLKKRMTPALGPDLENGVKHVSEIFNSCNSPATQSLPLRGVLYSCLRVGGGRRKRQRNVNHTLKTCQINKSCTFYACDLKHPASLTVCVTEENTCKSMIGVWMSRGDVENFIIIFQFLISGFMIHHNNRFTTEKTGKNKYCHELLMSDLLILKKRLKL